MSNDTHTEYYKRFDIPYQYTGFFIGGDIGLMIHGKLKHLDMWRSMNVVLSGRFDPEELTPISKDEADKLLIQHLGA